MQINTLIGFIFECSHVLKSCSLQTHLMNSLAKFVLFRNLEYIHSLALLEVDAGIAPQD